MIVYVLSEKAKVKRWTPFTIKLLQPTTEYVQSVVAGMDTGSEMKLIGAMLIVCAMTFSVSAEAQRSQWEVAADRYSIDPAILYSVALTESRVSEKNGGARPHPWTLRIGNRSLRFDSRVEMAYALRDAIATGISLRKIDIGIMQINAHWHKNKVETIFDLTDPVINIDVGARILKNAIASTSDLVVGVGRYHSYTSKRAKRYGVQVMGIVNRLKAYELF